MSRISDCIKAIQTLETCLESLLQDEIPDYKQRAAFIAGHMSGAKMLLFQYTHLPVMHVFPEEKDV